jgi:pyruvate kinase
VIQGGELKSKRVNHLIQNITSSDDRKDIADAIFAIEQSRLALSFVKTPQDLKTYKI